MIPDKMYILDEKTLLNPPPCCACGKTNPIAKNIILLDRRAPVPGTGWGCFTCGLKADGAAAIICDDCLKAKAPVKFALFGYLHERKLIPIETLTEKFEHDMLKHPLPTDEEYKP
jgi:hypothetical protein